MRAYRTLPDYSRPLLELSSADDARIRELLALLYGDIEAERCAAEVERLMRVHHAHKTDEMIGDDAAFDLAERFTERDVMLITYGDLVVSADEPPLEALARILEAHLVEINTVHLLPFFPYSSDRGFAVIDFEAVDPDLGDWADVERLAARFRLMFDGVFNHVSSESRWFREYLNGNPRYQEFFTAFTTRDAVSEERLRQVMRPRTSDLFSPFETIHGRRFLWTTFGPDQIDLNYRNPAVLMQVLGILLYYVRRGADLIRLDAVTYLWDELGGRSAHLRQTHGILKLFRAVLDVADRRVALVSETNVRHRDNISYFGDGHDEVHMVYNFALPPLVLHTFQSGDCRRLARWAASLEVVSDDATYLNFLDSHDGIGLLGARDILSDDEIETMIATAERHGGLVSHRTAANGEPEPYEINITWWSAMNRDDAGEDLDLQVDRYVASRSIALVLRGVPAIYLLGLVGSGNDREAVTTGGEARDINRRALDARTLEAMFSDPDTRGGRIVERLRKLLTVRRRHPAFHPHADQAVLLGNPTVFAVQRRSKDGSETILTLANMTQDRQEVCLEREDLEPAWPTSWKDLLSGRRLQPEDDRLAVRLDPYEVVWALAL